MAVTDGGRPVPAHDHDNTTKEHTVNHDETIALAEQHRADLLAHPGRPLWRDRSGRRLSLRQRLTRRR
ncbi:MAG TPA: hypothetical protein VFI47_12210 [Acidimicrobiales bacterium]|nr:hypothetical protein [Acidimicrobiales bacterium]